MILINTPLTPPPTHTHTHNPGLALTASLDLETALNYKISVLWSSLLSKSETNDTE